MMTMDDSIWQAIVNCDTTFDGEVVYGVSSTRIFCRPSCKSKTPLRENVRIFRNGEDAQAAGFRPCKRCRPDDLVPNEELIQRAKTILEVRYQSSLTLDTLARELAISPYHLHRVFKRMTGTTPAGYLLARRLRAAREALCSESYSTITDIAMSVGFRSASHFSTVFHKETGCSPTEYRDHHRQNKRLEEA